MSEEYRLEIVVSLAEDGNSAQVAIGADRELKPAAMMCATEHMMTLWATSCDDFERALKLLCEGARKNKLLMYRGNKIQ